MLGKVMKPDVVTEIEEDWGDCHGHSQCETCIQFVQLLANVIQTEVVVGNFAGVGEYITQLGTTKDSQSVGFLVDDVVTIQDGQIHAMD